MSTKFFAQMPMMTLLTAAVLCLNVYAVEESKDQDVTLPDAVTAAIKALYPQGEIEEAKQEDEDGLTVYEVEVEQGEIEVELTVTPDGQIIEEEQEIEVKDLPAAVQQALTGATVKEASKEITYYTVKDKQLEKLATPEIAYTAEIEKDGKTTEMEFNADGTVQKQEAGDEEEKDNDKD
ncbi:MAG: hypothetical protein LLF76_02230 [Planctomycetaceae bacterium]|nr:hypothetical protein [Planctomycetaceae bacterium]